MSEERSERNDSKALPNIAAVTGSLALLAACTADAEWDVQALSGIATFGLSGLVIGTLCLVNQRTGRVQAVMGTVTGAIGLEAFIYYFAAALR